MPALPVIPNCFRIRLTWSGSSSSRPVNVFHLGTSSGTVSQIAANLEANWTVAMIRPVSSSFSVTGVGITPLDGTTAEQFFTWTAAKAGQATGDIIPQAASVVSFRTLQRGPQGRGRMYLGPVGESVADAGFWNGTDRGICLAAWATFEAAMIAGTAASNLVVASYKHLDFHNVTTITGRSAMGTQRRRQDRLA